MESCNVNLKISLDELTSQKSSLEKESDDLKKVNLRAPLFFSTQYLKLEFKNEWKKLFQKPLKIKLDLIRRFLLNAVSIRCYSGFKFCMK